MNAQFSRSKGFTLIELMITIAIVGILAAIAIPSYLSYTNKARFSEVIQKADTLKNAVAMCAQKTGALTTCDGGSGGVPPNETTAVGNVASTAVADGVITVTGTATVGSYTYILTPTLTASGALTWVEGGTCQAAGYC